VFEGRAVKARESFDRSIAGAKASLRTDEIVEQAQDEEQNMTLLFRARRPF